MEGLKVTDVHVHIQPFEMVKPEAMEVLKLGKRDYEFITELRKSPSKFIELLDREGVWRVCLINYVAKEVLGFTEEVNAFSAEYASEYPDRLLPFGGVDPRSTDVEQRMEELVSKYEVRGIKIHPPHQLFFPNSYVTEGLRGLEVVYSMAEDNGLPVMIHTGTSIFPGARVRFGNPLSLDDVALDFPKLKIIMAHGGRPFWTEEAFFLLRRHQNLYFDVSSIPPKRLLHYFPRLEEVAHKTLFGSDWPGPMVPGIKHNLDDFLALPLSNDAKRAILETNSRRLFS
ncbi:MAG: amidohydrolase family protein [Candidatus Thermoplasmatota archaeon]|nr:amidohydrolase family protein [Candidatus Thermoplasmatota archaeon]